MMETKRLFGIDFYRAAAILMVLVANTIYFFQLQLPAVSALAPMIGYIGLEMFFVFCGFLLARSFYPMYLQENFGWLHLGSFLKNRLLRIVPLYFLVLLANMAIAAALNYPYFFAWKYFLFVQNFATTIPPFFPESWGLPVIVFATVLLTAFASGLSVIVAPKQKPAAFAFATIVLIAIFLWTKWLFHSQHPETDMTQWEAALKTVAIFRPDSVFIGVFFGWLSLEASVIWIKFKWIFAALGFAGLGFFAVGVGYLQLLIENHQLFWIVFYLPLTALILSFFLPVLSGWQVRPKFFGGPVVWVSTISYSIYLTHFSIVLLSMEHFLLNDFSGDSNLFALALAYFFAAIASGFLLHWLVEKRLSKALAG